MNLSGFKAALVPWQLTALKALLGHHHFQYKDTILELLRRAGCIKRMLSFSHSVAQCVRVPSVKIGSSGSNVFEKEFQVDQFLDTNGPRYILYL